MTEFNTPKASMSSNSCNYANCFDCVRVLYPLYCEWDLDNDHCYDPESSSSFNYTSSWRDCPGTCCSKYTSSSACTLDDDSCPSENCVWDLDNNVCLDTYAAGSYAEGPGDSDYDDTSISTAAIIGMCVGMVVLSAFVGLAYGLWKLRLQRRLLNTNITVEAGPITQIRYVDQYGHPYVNDLYIHKTFI